MVLTSQKLNKSHQRSACNDMSQHHTALWRLWHHFLFFKVFFSFKFSIQYLIIHFIWTLLICFTQSALCGDFSLLWVFINTLTVHMSVRHLFVFPINTLERDQTNKTSASNTKSIHSPLLISVGSLEPSFIPRFKQLLDVFCVF